MAPCLLIRYTPTPREILATNTCIKAYANDKTDALKMLDHAYKDFPNSPFVLQQHVQMFIIANDFGSAEKVFEKDKSKYSDQINLKIVADYLAKAKSAESAAEKIALRHALTQDLLALDEAIASIRVPASAKAEK